MRISIYQIDPAKDIDHVIYLSNIERQKRSGKKQVIMSPYNCVLEAEINANSLEEIYHKCNTDYSIGYYGRSMSVSDIIVVYDDYSEDPKTYYCDPDGFVEVDTIWSHYIQAVYCKPDAFDRYEILTHESIHKYVGDHYEIIYPYGDIKACIVCSTEISESTPVCRNFRDGSGYYTDIIRGNFLICGYNQFGLCSLSPSTYNIISKMMALPVPNNKTTWMPIRHGI